MEHSYDGFMEDDFRLVQTAGFEEGEVEVGEIVLIGLEFLLHVLPAPAHH